MISNSFTVCQAHSLHGQILLAASEPRKAIESFEAALALAQMVAPSRQPSSERRVVQEPVQSLLEASCHSNIGLALNRLGEHSRALKKHYQHLERAQKLDDAPALLTALANLGSSLQCLGMGDQALKLHEVL